MRVTWLPDAERRPRRLAVGEFDGVHLGHRAVIGDRDTVLTFDPHPRAVVAPDAAPKLITPLPVKADIVAGLGVRELVVIPFDGEFAKQTAQEFIDDVLIGALGPSEVSVGENFRFGHKARGDVALLQAQHGLRDAGVEMVEVEGEIVSSTHIRGLIVAGDVGRAATSWACRTTCAASSATATSAAARSASRPPTSCPTTRSCTPATGSTPAAPRSRSTVTGSGGPPRSRSACGRPS